MKYYVITYCQFSNSFRLSNANYYVYDCVGVISNGYKLKSLRRHRVYYTVNLIMLYLWKLDTK